MLKNQNLNRLEEFSTQPHKALWKLALPLVAGMIVQNVYNVVDMIFVGRLGEDAIAALAFNIPLVFFSLGLIFGLGTGATAVIAQAIGAGDKKLADNSAEHTVILGLFLSLIIALLGIWFGESILKFIGAPTNILHLAYDYFSIYVGGIGFMIMAVFFRSILTGEGNTSFPMIVISIGTIMNIILDPIFIFVLDFGIKGAAIATIISQATVCLIFIYALYVKKHSYITFKIGDFSFSPIILKRIVFIGFPASLSMVIMSVGSGVFNRILVTFSTHAVAAFQIGHRLNFFAIMPILAIAGSIVTLVGMFYGAKRFNLLLASIHHAQRSAVLCTITIGIVFFVFAKPIISVFTESNEIIQIGSEFLRILVFGLPFVAMAITSNRSMQGMGHSLPMMVITLLRVIGIAAPLAWVLTQLLGKPLHFVWYSMVISSMIASTISYLWMRKIVRQIRFRS